MNAHILLGAVRSLYGVLASAVIMLSMAAMTLGARVAEAAPFAYVTNYGSDTVSVIDTATNKVSATIPVGHAPDGVAITSDGSHAYVANLIGTISVIDTATNTVSATIHLAGVTSPRGVAITPDGNHAYVTDVLNNTVWIIDTATNMVVGSPISVGIYPFRIAIVPDGKHAYVVNNASDGTISVVDTVTNTVSATIPVGNYPQGVAITADGNHAYVTNFNYPSGGTVSVIDTATNTVSATIPGVGSGSSGVAITPDGSHAYVVNQLSGNVSVIDTATNKVVGSPIPVEFNSIAPNPQSVAITPDGKHAYVTNFNSSGYNGTVSVIDTATHMVVGFPIPVGDLPSSVAITPAAASDALDDFNRPNGKLGSNWSRSTGLDYYKIVNNQVTVRLGGPIYWKPTSFGTNQEAFVTLTTVNPNGFEHGLTLKAQSGPNAINYRRGVINVDYRAQDNAVLVSTYRPNRRWKEYPAIPSVTFNNGDKLTARVYGEGPNAGTVHVYKNGAEIGSVTLSNADQAFFNSRGGNIGLWFDNASGATFDNFGGGTP